MSGTQAEKRAPGDQGAPGSVAGKYGPDREHSLEKADIRREGAFLENSSQGERGCSGGCWQAVGEEQKVIANHEYV